VPNTSLHWSAPIVARVSLIVRRFMDTIATLIALVLSGVVTGFCWHRISRSAGHLFFKMAFSIIAAIPFLGPLLYFFADMPPRHSPWLRGDVPERAKSSTILLRWKEREHIYLLWAGVVLVVLSVVAYWIINDWTPGTIPSGYLGMYTDVDILFFWLLLLAVLCFGWALRAKVILMRYIESETSNHAFENRCAQERRVPVQRER
jgi:hypothetical protein